MKEYEVFHVQRVFLQIGAVFIVLRWMHRERSLLLVLAVLCFAESLYYLYSRWIPPRKRVAVFRNMLITSIILFAIGLISIWIN